MTFDLSFLDSPQDREQLMSDLLRNTRNGIFINDNATGTFNPDNFTTILGKGIKVFPDQEIQVSMHLANTLQAQEVTISYFPTDTDWVFRPDRTLVELDSFTGTGTVNIEIKAPYGTPADTYQSFTVYVNANQFRSMMVVNLSVQKQTIVDITIPRIQVTDEYGKNMNNISEEEGVIYVERGHALKIFLDMKNAGNDFTDAYTLELEDSGIPEKYRQDRIYGMIYSLSTTDFSLETGETEHIVIDMNLSMKIVLDTYPLNIILRSTVTGVEIIRISLILVGSPLMGWFRLGSMKQARLTLFSAALTA